MRSRKVSTALLVGGVTVGVVTTAALFLGFEPAPLSPAIVKIALYKLTYFASGGLLIAGAVVGRWATRAELRTAARQELLDRGARAALPTARPRPASRSPLP